MAERKKYVEVNVPLLAKGLRVLGTPESLNNKTIKLDLTRKLRGKGLTLTFRIFNKDSKLIGLPNRSELVKSYIQRMMRKRTDYVEDSFEAQCLDLKAIIKPFLITRKKVSRAVRKNLRNTAREFLIEYVKDKEFTDLFQDILNGTLQKSMIPKLKKVYPLSFCDLRIFETKEIQKLDLNKELSKETQRLAEEVEYPADEETVKEEVEETVKEEVEEEPTEND